MANVIKFEEIDEYVKRQFETLLAEAVLDADRSLKKVSPVDTGRFRFSWQVGQNSNEGSGAPPGNYTGIPGIRRTNYQRETAGNVYSIFNNLPYAERLAGGWSKKAPSGWVQNVAKSVQVRVNAAAARIGRDS